MTTNGHVTELTPDEARKLVGRETGSGFAVDDRIFRSFDDDTVLLSHEVEAQDLARMLAADGNARKIERVLSLPIRGAGWDITGQGREAAYLREHVGPLLGRLVEQCTGALVYRRAFFEKVWAVRDGLFVFSKLAWRPPSSCQARFNERTAAEDGFEQRLAGVNLWTIAQTSAGGVPGSVTIPRHKAFVYTHGKHREPVKGVSELEVAYNAFDKKQKIKFLWGQYLEGQSLPKLAAYGRDAGEAQANAELHAAARASGVVPQVLTADQPRAFDVIESSGKGAEQFVEAIRYFDAEQTNSVLAGFTDLAGAAAAGRGSYALSADQSEFFLASCQAVADEIADQIRDDVFAPLVVLNFGVDAEVPELRIGPIGNRQTDRALELLSGLLVASGVNAPDDFLDQLITLTAPTLGMDAERLGEALRVWRNPPVNPNPPAEPTTVPTGPVAVAAARPTQGALFELTGDGHGRHIPGTPYEYRHGWVRVGMREITDDDRSWLAEQGIKPPPGWTHVQVAHDRGADLLVHGRDTKGRPQSIYSAAHTRRQAAAKFERIERLHRAIPTLDAALARDAEHDDDAAAVLLIRRMGLRPGSDADTGAEKKAHGATNLAAKHARVDGDQVRLQFGGKKGVELDLTTDDPELAGVLRSRLADKGPEDRLLRTDERRAGAYLKRVAPGYKLKDLRTYRGTAEARAAVAEIPVPTSRKEYDKARRAVGKRVSGILGNTPAVALESYVNPAVFAAWEAALQR